MEVTSLINYTVDCYEMKREILNFSKKMSEGLNKKVTKFISDMKYGLSKSKSCLISEISKSLDERVKLKNTIERLYDNLQSLDKEETRLMKENYLNEVKNYFPDEAIFIFDDSDISKRYGKKFEDLDQIIEASDPDKRVVNGDYICEAVIMVFDRGCDDSKIISYVDKSGNYFVIRMNDKRNFLFKGKKKMPIKRH